MRTETEDTERCDFMFKTRLISGIILVALALVFIMTGGPVLLTVMAVISCIGAFELYRIFGIEKSPVGILGYAFIVIYYVNLYIELLPDAYMIIAPFLILLLAFYVFAYPKYKADQIMAAFFGFFYVAVMLSYMYQTRMLENGGILVWLIFLCSWGCDTCAYCVGMLIGKHKMSPVLSPKKSVEGAVGGVVGAMLLTALYTYIFRVQLSLDGKSILVMAIAAGVAALISMVGDLAASAIKRNYDIKDYGKLIPGHGGILDRFDSVIITAPIIYFLAAMFI